MASVHRPRRGPHNPLGRSSPARGLAGILAASLIGLVALAGCSASDMGGDNAAPGGAPAFDAEQDSDRGVAGAPEAPAPTVATNSDSSETAPTALEERALIYSGTITVGVESVVRAADEAIAMTIGLGGVVAGDSRTIDGDFSQAMLILRVPADDFTSTLDRLGRLGTEESRQVKADDVTDQLVDLDARIATQEASVNRVRDLLARAQTIAEIVTLESELTRRQAELDSLKQRRAATAGLVALSTITVVLHGPDAVIAPEEPETGFLAGLKAGWKGFLASVTIVLTVAGWLLPWAIAFGAPILIVLWILRRRRRRARPTPPAPTA